MILSVGVGYQEADFSAFGIPIKERARRTEEGVEIIRKCWSDERFSYRGKHYQLDQLFIAPKPVQKPGPPIWMVAWSDVGLKRTARLADGWITDPCQSLGVIERLADEYRGEATKQGRKPFIALMRDVWVADSWETARRESGPMMYTHRFYYRNKAYIEDEMLRSVRSEEEWTFDLAAKDRLIAGSPEDCREQLARWNERVNPDYLIVHMRYPGGPEHWRVVKGIQDFVNEILPHL